MVVTYQLRRRRRGRRSSCSAPARSPRATSSTSTRRSRPLGAAINGKSKGDTVTYEAPNGKDPEGRDRRRGALPPEQRHAGCTRSRRDVRGRRSVGPRRLTRRPVAALAQPASTGSACSVAAGLELDLHLDLVEVQRRRDPLVRDLEHVGAGVADLGEQPRPGRRAGRGSRRAGRGSGRPRPSPCRITLPSSSGSMLPPESTATAGVSKAVGCVQDRRHRRRPGRLDDHLGPLDQRQQRPRERLLGDGDDLVDVRPAPPRTVMSPGPADRDAVGHRRHRLPAAPGRPPATTRGRRRRPRPAPRPRVRRGAAP